MQEPAAKHLLSRQWARHLAVAVALLGALAVTPRALADDEEAREAGAAGTVPTCPVGAALARAGQPDEALKTYVGVIKLHPRSTCAPDGIKNLPKKTPPSECATAYALRKAKQSDPSRSAYVEVLKSNPASPCAPYGLARLDEPAKSCALGDALRAAEQTDAAQTAYQAVLKADPESDCAHDGLKKLEAETTIPKHAANLLGDIGGALTTLVGWLALVLGSLALGILVLALWSRSRAKLLEVRWIDRLLAPRLRLRDIDNAGVDPAIGNGVMALEREYLARTTAEPAPSAGYELDQNAGQEDLTGVVQGIEGFGSYGKMVSSVLQLVTRALPRARFTASGTLQKDGARGAGMTILLEGAAKPLGVTLWSGPQEDTAPNGAADRYMSLAVPAAAWIDYQVREALGAKKPGITESAQSYALLQGGIECQASGDRTAAARFYRAALEADPWNEAALLNLANLLAREEKEYPVAIRLLEQTVVATRNHP